MGMNANLIEEVFSRIRPLGFGGLLGSGLMGLLYILLKEKIPHDITYHYFLTVGGLIGAGFHKMIDSVFSLVTCGSIGRFVILFEKLIQLALLGLFISPEKAKELKDQIITELMIGISIKKQTAISDNIARGQLETQKQQLALLDFESSNNARSFVDVSDRVQRMQLESEKSIYEANRKFEEMDKQIQQRVEESLLKVTNANKKLEQKKVSRNKTNSKI